MGDIPNGGTEFEEEYIGERYAPAGCCFSSALIAISYALFIILWKITFLCVAIPAILAGILLLFAVIGNPWKVKIAQVIFVLVAFTPMAVMFAMHWCHWKP